jgi:hypothetical protein
MICHHGGVLIPLLGGKIFNQNTILPVRNCWTLLNLLAAATEVTDQTRALSNHPLCLASLVVSTLEISSWSIIAVGLSS